MILRQYLHTDPTVAASFGSPPEWEWAIMR